MLANQTTGADSTILAGALSRGDIAIVVTYMLASIGIGIWIGRRQAGIGDYFLGGRRMSSWTVLLSTVATETSTVTFLSVPGITFALDGDFRFLQITFGYVIGRLFVSIALLPAYFADRVETSYELLRTRFGTATRQTCSLLFLVTRNVSDALRLFLTALAVSEVMNVGMVTAIVAVGIATIVYTSVGGIRSVVFNDCVQFIVYIGGALMTVWVLGQLIPEGWTGIIEFGNEQGKLRLFEWDITRPGMTFWSGLIGGAFLTLATHGTDHMMVQRMLSAKSLRTAQIAMTFSGLFVLLQFALFLLIGVGLAALQAADPSFADETLKNDAAYARFIVTRMPNLLRGVLLAAVFSAAMSTLSSSVSASASALIGDFYLVRWPDRASDRSTMLLSRLATVAFGLIQIALALVAYRMSVERSVVSSVLAIAGFTSGPILGVFLLARFVPRISQAAALVGVLAGIETLTIVWYCTAIHWSWYTLIGAVATIVSSQLWGFDARERAS